MKGGHRTSLVSKLRHAIRDTVELHPLDEDRLVSAIVNIMETDFTTVQEAGRKGGMANAAKHDHAHFVRIGKLGPTARWKRHNIRSETL